LGISFLICVGGGRNVTDSEYSKYSDGLDSWRGVEGSCIPCEILIAQWFEEVSSAYKRCSIAVYSNHQGVSLVIRLLVNCFPIIEGNALSLGFKQCYFF
jgi:hypothetical protein